MVQAEIFKDLKVIELAGVLAGPGVGLFFAELGAQVIKIENPGTRGDVTRSWKLKSEDPKNPYSAYFWSVNAFKKFKSLDLTVEKELTELYELVKTADIVIANYKAGDDKKLKVDYDTLSEINPQLIYASINGFGGDSSRAAYDLILQAESGYMSINGEPNSPPLKMPVALVDVIAGHHLKEAVLIALIRKMKEKKGSYLQVSLFESALSSLVNQATNWLVAKQLPKSQGSLHPNIAPYGEIFETRDQQRVTFAIGSNKQFKSLCTILGNSGLSKESIYATNQLRVSNRQQLYTTLYDYVKQINFADLYQRCHQQDVPIGKIRNIKEVFELTESKNMLREFAHEGEKIKTVSSIAFRIIK